MFSPVLCLSVLRTMGEPQAGPLSGHVTLRREVYLRDWKAMTFQGTITVQGVLGLNGYRVEELLSLSK
jgi:hypothetical protein